MVADTAESTTHGDQASGRETTPVPGALGALLHVAVLSICGLAVYSTAAEGPIDWAETHPQGNPILAALIAVLVAVPLVARRAQLARKAYGKLVLALGLAYVFRLAFMPLLPDSLLGSAASAYQLSWANVALPVLLLAWCLCRRARGSGALGFTGLESSVAVSALALCALAIALHLWIGKHYSADATYAIALIVKAVQYGLICIIAVTISGAGRVGAWPHAYVAAALIASVLISLAAGGAETEAQYALGRGLL